MKSLSIFSLLTALFSLMTLFAADDTRDGLSAGGVTVNGTAVTATEWRQEPDGVAVRYVLPKGRRVISGEATRWTLPTDATCWYQEGPGSYEHLYTTATVADIPVGTRMNFPVTFKLTDGTYRLVTEANLVDFTDGALEYAGAGVFKLIHYAEKTGSFEQTGVDHTPWRVMLVAKDLNTLANSDLVRRLCPEPTNAKSIALHKPGRCTWQWLPSGDPVYAEQKDWYDRTKALGFEYYLIDDGWKTWRDGEKDQWACLKAAIDYGKSIGVKTAMWVDSKEMPDAASRRAYLQKVVASGAVGIKIDFVPTCDSKWCKWYEETLADTAELGLFVDFHGAVKPTGREKTWPHELAREAIRGHEWHVTRYHRILPPEHDTIIPFCRAVQGHGDYTPVVFEPKQLIHFTWPRQLAQGVVMTCPFLCFGDFPKNYEENPMREILEALPSVYDETRILPGSEIGGCVAMARRAGNTWFIAVENGADARSLRFRLDFLKDGAWRLLEFTDDPSGRLDAAVRGERTVTPADALTLAIRPCGGYIARLVPVGAGASSVGLEASAGATEHPVSERCGWHENQDWFEFRGFHYTDAKKNLPRVFLLGDSLNGQYRKGVQERFEGLANVTWFTGCYCVSAPQYRRHLELYLEDADYDVIHINNGLHSFQTDLAVYEAKLREMLQFIRAKQPKAKLIWARTTPLADVARNARVDAMNAIADRVAREVGVDAVDDLHAAMMSVPTEERWSDGCHAKPAAVDALVAAVSKSVLPFVSAKPLVTMSPCHEDHFEDGIMAIIHFGLNTFVDKEWGYGDTPPSVFNPTKLDTDQWVDAMTAAGIRRVVMVTKHHDGFNLWPSPENKDYTVANSPWKDGKGDVVKMIHDSCLKKGLRFGVYLSPWDRHQGIYATPAYTDYYHKQFEELFANYGPISEIWLDGANGGDGWYGGANERRKLAVPAWDYYRMPRLLERMHELYPRAIAFGGHGPNSAVWVGNEAGYAPQGVRYETKRGFWETPECDTPLRKGWFWSGKDRPKALAKLVDIYFASVGRGCILNLGIAPNREGLVGEDDVRRLKELGDFIRAFNAVDYAKGARVWTAPGSYQVDLTQPTEVSAVDVREDLALGQKVRAWRLECSSQASGNDWTPLCEAATIGYRRIERFAPVTARRFRVVITEGEPGAVVKSVALRRVPAIPEDPTYVPDRRWFSNNGEQVTISYGVDKTEFVARWTYPSEVKGFKFDPQHNLGNLPDKWELRLSDDGKTWGEPVASGEFGNIVANPVEQIVDFEKPLKIRWAKLTARHAAKGEATFNPNHVHTIIFY